ncbi:hypothetical protein FHS10_002979 [Mucilaginibacter dorajii]|nr:hypothetical protein [Mucilaginibacter dorajii]
MIFIIAAIVFFVSCLLCLAAVRLLPRNKDNED